MQHPILPLITPQSFADNSDPTTVIPISSMPTTRWCKTPFMLRVVSWLKADRLSGKWLFLPYS